MRDREQAFARAQTVGRRMQKRHREGGCAAKNFFSTGPSDRASNGRIRFQNARIGQKPIRRRATIPRTRATGFGAEETIGVMERAPLATSRATRSTPRGTNADVGAAAERRIAVGSSIPIDEHHATSRIGPPATLTPVMKVRALLQNDAPCPHVEAAARDFTERATAAAFGSLPEGTSLTANRRPPRIACGRAFAGTCARYRACA